MHCPWSSRNCALAELHLVSVNVFIVSLSPIMTCLTLLKKFFILVLVTIHSRCVYSLLRCTDVDLHLCFHLNLYCFVLSNLVLLVAGMLDHVIVMSHGVQTPLSHVAAVSVSSLETLTVMPYDTSVSPDDSNL